ncbi:DUF29 family protein [Synechococcus sp. PCC 6312]
MHQEIYDDARQITSLKTGLDIEIFPQVSIATIEQVLDESWLLDY